MSLNSSFEEDRHSVGQKGHLSYSLQEASPLFLKQSKSSQAIQRARVLRQYRATPVCNNKVMWRDEPNWSGGKNFSVYSSPVKRYLNTAFVGKFQFQLNTAKMKIKQNKKKKNKIRVFIERLWKYFLISNLKPQAPPKCSTTEIITSIGHQAKVKPYLQ